MKNYIAYFVVEVYDDEECRKDAGFIPANTFGEPMDYLEEYYGNELSVVHHIELLDISMLTMTPEVAEEFLDKIY
jgi:hypothetical protein